MGVPSSNLGRAVAAVLLLLVAAAAGRVAFELGSFALASDRLPQWDPAKYGVAGVRLADAVRAADPVAFIREVNRLSLWPPLFPLAEIPVFLAFGADYRVAAAMVAVLVLLTALAAFWAGRWMVLAGSVDRHRLQAGAPGAATGSTGPRARSGFDEVTAALAGALAALLVLASPFVHLFGTLVMLEVPGVLLLFAAAGAYARSLATGRFVHWRWACAAATALFFLKYNYGLLWLAPLALSEPWIAAAASGDEPGPWVRRWLATRLRAIDLAKPWTWFVLLYLAALASIVATGGWELRLAGRVLEARSIGNPLYALCLLFAIRHLAWPRRRRELLARDRRLGARGHAAVRWIALPIAAWMLLPPHLKDFVKFVGNRSSDIPPWSLESFIFYPRAFVADFSPHLALGVGVLFLAAYPLADLRRLPPARRTLGLALAVGATAAILHPYKLPRFLFPLAPLLWLSAAGTVAAALGAVRTWADRPVRGTSGAVSGEPRRARQRSPRLLATALPAGAGVALAAWAAWIAATGGVDRERLDLAHAARSVPSAVRPLLDALADAAADGAADADADDAGAATDAPGSIVLGTWNDLSPALVEWHCRLRHPGIAEGAIPRDAGRLVPRATPLALLDRAARPGSGIGRVLVLAPLGDGPRAAATFAAETAWADPARAALGVDPRFTLETDHHFPAAGYRLPTYRVVPSELVHR